MYLERAMRHKQTVDVQLLGLNLKSVKNIYTFKAVVLFMEIKIYISVETVTHSSNVTTTIMAFLSIGTFTSCTVNTSQHQVAMFT